MKKANKWGLYLAPLLLIFLLGSCDLVRPGHVGVNIQLGKVQDRVLGPGYHNFFRPFTRIVEFDARTINHTQSLTFHTDEGIHVSAEITTIFHIEPDSAASLYNRFGTDYEHTFILDHLVTALRRAGIKHQTVNLITDRNKIEQEVLERLDSIVSPYGIHFDFVMLKELHLPERIQQTIKAKLNAAEVARKTEIDNKVKRAELEFELERSRKQKQLEIDNRRMEIDFAIERERKEAERLLIQAEATRKSQELIGSSLTDNLIEIKRLEVTKGLMESNNTKVIITDGKSPIVLDPNSR